MHIIWRTIQRLHFGLLLDSGLLFMVRDWGVAANECGMGLLRVNTPRSIRTASILAWHTPFGWRLALPEL